MYGPLSSFYSHHNTVFAFPISSCFLVSLLVSSTPLSIKCQTGFFLLGKPKKESLKEEYREALNTFFACRGLPLLSDTAKVDIYLRRKMKNQTVTSTLYDRAKKPAVTRLSTVTVVERHNLEMYAVMSTVKISLWQL